MHAINRIRSRGQILIIVALTMIVLIGFAALAIDSGLSYGVKAKLNAAVDAAALAGARATVFGNDDGARATAATGAAQKFFDLNFPASYLGTTPGRVVPTISAVPQANGKWQVSVSADATRPTFLMGVLGLQSMTIHAQAVSVRRSVDLVLVIDTSGSLGPPYSSSTTFGQVQSAAKDFVGKFAAGPGGDRVALVAFASGAQAKVHFKANFDTGFTLSDITGAIDALSVGGSTASAEAMRIARDEIDAVPAAQRSSLRVIVFFSDGAPNDVNANFALNTGAAATCVKTVVTGGRTTHPTSTSCDLYSDPATSNGASLAYHIYPNDETNGQSYAYATSSPGDRILTLPATGLGGYPLSGMRGLSGSPPANTLCNVNKAARNMVENVATALRGEGVMVMTIGLGGDLTVLEPQYSNHCISGTAELGTSILKRLANTSDSDTFTPPSSSTAIPPTGYYAYAANQSQLDSAFNAVASQILRLTQ